MLKTLVEEVTFGKAIARITVTMFTEKKYLDGVDINQENVITTSKIEIVVNGKVVESGYSADVLEFNELTSTYFNKNKLDVTKKYTRVGNKAMTVGAETGNLINAKIKEMTAVLSKEFNIETEAEKQQKEEIEEAQAVVAQVAKEGADQLMSEDEIKSWRKRYNDAYNEGGEGYIPVKISREMYQKSLNLLRENGIMR